MEVSELPSPMPPQAEAPPASIPVLTITFATALPPGGLSAFRGALVEAIGREQHWFHNHSSSEGPGLHYRYPRIQYKARGGKPMLYCMGEGLEAARALIEQPPLLLRYHDGHSAEAAIEAFEFRRSPALLAPPTELRYAYRLRQWQALSQRNYAHYRSLGSMQEVVDMLEQVLASQILVFARAAGWRLPQRLEVRIRDMRPLSRAEYKGFEALLFDVGFRSNILLPDWTGLGKGAALGFGTLRRWSRPDF